MPQGDVYLHQCAKCGTFWVFEGAEARTVSEEQARRDFPDAFA